MVNSIEPRLQADPIVETKSAEPVRRRGPVQPSVSDRLFSVKDDLITLYQQEVSLAKTELQEGLNKTKASASSLGTGAVLMVGGSMLLLATLSLLISWACVSAGLALLPSLVIGFATLSLLTLGIGAVMLKAGKKKLINQSLAAPKTQESLRRSKEIAQEQVS